MPASLIDGKAIAKKIRLDCAQRCARLKEAGITPTLAVILCGDNPASQIYVRNKVRACEECGIRSELIRLPGTVTQQELHEAIAAVNADPSIHGLLVQLPLPNGLSEREALLSIDPSKDVDGLHPVNAGALLLGDPGFVPCTPAGCMELIASTGVCTDGASAVVIGRSNIVGKPVSLLLTRANCTVTVCHSHTKNLADVVRQADIVVAAVGVPRLITREMVKPGAVVIDVGMNRLPDGKLCGDVDFDSVCEVAGHITPVPGGVGPMTVAMLMRNTLRAAAHE